MTHHVGCNRCPIGTMARPVVPEGENRKTVGTTETQMRTAAYFLATFFVMFATPTFASCKSDAADKRLAGAALKSFMTKCERDAKTTCEADSKARKLAGAAKNSHMNKCY